MMARRGLLGGTFDPVHAAHLALADAAHRTLGLDGVWFLPAGEPWMKRDARLSAKGHRRAMVELAIAGDERFHLSTLELERPGPTYTVDTLEELRRGEAPGWDGELWFIVGADTLGSMHRWKDPERLLALARVAVATRPGAGEPDLGPLEAVAPNARERVTTLPMPPMDVSGTDVRSRAAGGEPLNGLVPEAVAAYIARHDLYGGTHPQPAATSREG